MAWKGTDHVDGGEVIEAIRRVSDQHGLLIGINFSRIDFEFAGLNKKSSRKKVV